jgi:hypothetical protein
VRPRFPVRLLQPHFSVVELALGTRPQGRNIHLWCRATLLEDPVFVAIKDSILAQAAAVSQALAGEEAQPAGKAASQKAPRRRKPAARG